MIASGEIQYDNYYFINTGAIQYGDTRLTDHVVDLKNKCIYIIYMASSITQTVLIEKFNLDGIFLTSWTQSNLQVGLSRVAEWCLNEDHTKLVFVSKLDTDTSGSIRLSSLNIDFNTFSNSTLSISDSFSIGNIQHGLDAVGGDSDYYYFVGHDGDLGNGDISFYRIDLDLDITSYTKVFDVTTDPAIKLTDQFFNYKTKEVSFLVRKIDNYIQYWTFNWLTNTLTKSSNEYTDFNYGTDVNSQKAFLLNEVNNKLKIAFIDNQNPDIMYLGTFTKDMVLITKDKILLDTNVTERRNHIITLSNDASIIAYLSAGSFYKLKTIQGTKDIITLSGNISGVNPIQSDKTIPILNGDIGLISGELGQINKN